MQWYHHEHRHSTINFVTPEERRKGKDFELLKKRDELLKAHLDKHPERFSKGITRNFSRITQVTLNPDSKLDNKKLTA